MSDNFYPIMSNIWGLKLEVIYGCSPRLLHKKVGSTSKKKGENVFSEIISPHCIRALLLYTGWPSPMNKELRQLKLPIKFAIQFLTSFLNNHWTNKHNCSVNILKNSWNWDYPQRTKGPDNSKAALHLISISSLVCVYIWFK